MGRVYYTQPKPHIFRVELYDWTWSILIQWRRAFFLFIWISSPRVLKLSVVQLFNQFQNLTGRKALKFSIKLFNLNFNTMKLFQVLKFFMTDYKTDFIVQKCSWLFGYKKFLLKCICLITKISSLKYFGFTAVSNHFSFIKPIK
jgi:hypothetical protein